MKTLSDYAYLAASRQRDESMGLTTAGRFWLTYGTVLVIVVSLVLAVLGVRK